MSTNPRKTTVEPKGSKEFESTKDELPMEVVHAADVLEAYFKEQGYDQWLFKGICSRKLLEKVQKREPNPQYVTVPVELEHRNAFRVVNPNQRPDDGLIRVGPPPVAFVDMPMWVDQAIAENDQQVVVDPQPYTGIEVGPEPVPYTHEQAEGMLEHLHRLQRQIDAIPDNERMAITQNTAGEVHAQAVLRDVAERAIIEQAEPPF